MQFTEQQYSQITQITLEIKFMMDRIYKHTHAYTHDKIELFKQCTFDYLNKKTIKELHDIVKKFGGHFVLSRYFFEHTKNYPRLHTEFKYLLDLISLRVVLAYNKIKDQECLTMIA